MARIIGLSRQATGLLILLGLLPARPAIAGDPARGLPSLKADPHDLDWWRAAKFGLFVHWDPISLKGAEISWSRGGERRGSSGTGEIPVDEYDQLKSAGDCIRTLVRVAGGDGNLLLNVGPMPNGEIEPRQVERLKDIGRWLRQNGRTIYGTRGGPIKPRPWGVSTGKGRTLFVHVLQWDDTGSIQLPRLDRRIVRCSLLGGGEVALVATPSGVELRVPPEHRHAPDTIIALKLDGPASALTPR